MPPVLAAPAKLAATTPAAGAAPADASGPALAEAGFGDALQQAMARAAGPAPGGAQEGVPGTQARTRRLAGVEGLDAGPQPPDPSMAAALLASLQPGTLPVPVTAGLEGPVEGRAAAATGAMAVRMARPTFEPEAGPAARAPAQPAALTRPSESELQANLGAVAGSRLPAREEPAVAALPEAPAPAPQALPDAAQAGALTAPGGRPAVPAEAARLAVSTPLGSSDWGAAFADRIGLVVQARQSSAELQVSPPELGPIDIRLTLQGDQASLSFASPHAAVREAIQAAMPRLADALSASGLSLGNVSVGADSRRGGEAPREGRGQRGGPHVAGIEAISGAPAMRWTGAPGELRSVDLFA